MNRRGYYLIFIAVVSVLSFTFKEKKIRIYLIGDSTIANKETKAYPETGWGMPFKYFFDSSVVVDNRAKNGRSTRTFISENLWQPIEADLNEGDYVFMQFGHNDEVPEKTDRYTPPTDYKKNLHRFIDEARNKKAIPIVLTPVARRKFDKEGNVVETHEEYSRLAREVAAEAKVPLIDLDEKSKILYQQFGDQTSRLLFLQLQPGEHPNYPDGKEDNTHFSELGARKIAELVLAEIRNLHLELEGHIVKPKPK
jgi:lysophospholipase L1-like esterase